MLNRLNVSLVLFLMLVLLGGTTTAIATETTIYNASFVMKVNGERAESDIIDSGSVDIDFECVDSMRGEKTWRVWCPKYKYGFKMTVSNNKVKEYENEWIDFPSYYNKSFTGTSTFVMLSFTFNSSHGVYHFRMVAKVTGFNNDIRCNAWAD